MNTICTSVGFTNTISRNFFGRCLDVLYHSRYLSVLGEKYKMIISQNMFSSRKHFYTTSGFEKEHNASFIRQTENLPQVVLMWKNKTPHEQFSLKKVKHLHTSFSNNISEDHRTKALQVVSDLKHLKSSPLPALVLGFAGLLPFAGIPMYFISNQLYMPGVAFAQLAYGACVLSFLGGVRWGLTLPDNSICKPDWNNLSYSTVPLLAAWTGLMLPNPINYITVITGYGLAVYFDITMYGYPTWFKALRFTLSVIAILAMWSALMCSLLYEHDKQKGEVKSI